MFRLGELQTLEVAEIGSHGAMLTEEGERERVLLPGRYMADGLAVGDKVEVFVYMDSEDRPVATTDMPLLFLHKVGRLTVKEVGKVGAFLDWGLPKDLLLPFGNQTAKVKQGESVLCAPIIDKSQRLCATMNVYEYLEKSAPHSIGEWVKGTIYETSGNFGAFVAVDDIYSGLIPKNELTRKVRIGEEVSARVAKVTDDGRLTLSLREKAYLQMDKDAEAIMSHLESRGPIPFTDKADPEVIRDAFGMSKAQFKRAVGRLLKMGKIEIGEDSIHE